MQITSRRAARAMMYSPQRRRLILNSRFPIPVASYQCTSALALQPLRSNYREQCSCKWRRSRQALCERARSDAVLAPRPAGASGESTTTASDNLVNIEFTSRSGVEALLDFRLQPCKQLAATLLVQD